MGHPAQHDRVEPARHVVVDCSAEIEGAGLRAGAGESGGGFCEAFCSGRGGGSDGAGAGGGGGGVGGVVLGFLGAWGRGGGSWGDMWVVDA